MEANKDCLSGAPCDDGLAHLFFLEDGRGATQRPRKRVWRLPTNCPQPRTEQIETRIEERVLVSQCQTAVRVFKFLVRFVRLLSGRAMRLDIVHRTTCIEVQDEVFKILDARRWLATSGSHGPQVRVARGRGGCVGS